MDMPVWTDFFPEQDGYGEGFFVQVDIEIPEDLHDHLQYLPPAPCHTSVPTSSLPPHMQEMYRQRYGEGAKDSTPEKLIASLMDKKDVVLHYTTAEMYARLGVKLKVKKVLRFIQGRVLENWIKKATLGRKAAALAGDDLLVAVYKLIINSVFGKKHQDQKKKSSNDHNHNHYSLSHNHPSSIEFNTDNINHPIEMYFLIHPQ